MRKASIIRGSGRTSPAIIRAKRHVAGVVAVHQHLRVAVGQPVTPLALGLRGIVHLDEAGHCLLLEPLAKVAPVGVGAAAISASVVLPSDNASIDPELVAHVNGVDVGHAEYALEQALDERVTSCGGGWFCNGHVRGRAAPGPPSTSPNRAGPAPSSR